jgi:predicted nucleotide-binding protein
MSDLQKIATALITDGERFTFENHSTKRELINRCYGGPPGPKWEAWLKRLHAFIEKHARQGTEPFGLLREAEKLRLQGDYNSDGIYTTNFDLAKEYFISAIQSVADIDAAGDLHSKLNSTTPPAIDAEPKVEGETQQQPSASRRVFIVHGHEEAAKEKVARLVERLGLEAIILHEQPNKGRTIIEKFTDHADVSFAIVLMTADDVGGVKGMSSQELKPRARQNVVLELGYFLGRLGRGRVCAVFDTEVEMPSDYAGVLFLPLDDGGAWRSQLAKEMKAAGIPIDISEAL